MSGIHSTAKSIYSVARHSSTLFRRLDYRSTLGRRKRLIRRKVHNLIDESRIDESRTDETRGDIAEREECSDGMQATEIKAAAWITIPTRPHANASWTPIITAYDDGANVSPAGLFKGVRKRAMIRSGTVSDGQRPFVTWVRVPCGTLIVQLASQLRSPLLGFIHRQPFANAWPFMAGSRQIRVAPDVHALANDLYRFGWHACSI